MHNTLERTYDAFYHERTAFHVYPVEFVVRAFLGSYPRLHNKDRDYREKNVLDLGCGDGRNMPLLSNLGMHVHGVEISESICDLTRGRMKSLGVDAEIRVGRNRAIPFEDRRFDELLACHACYYVDPGTTFRDNLLEIARVLAPGGRFVFSAPTPSTYILRDAVDLGDGHLEVANDPYGLRNGYVLKCFADEDSIAGGLSPYFDDFAIGCCRNDFWGIEEHVWTVVCRRTECPAA
ncbi:MAG: class I SAM-dependent methyltransferase [Pirellulaceae bacterium]